MPMNPDNPEELSPRQHLFVQHYLGGAEGVRFNGAAAARQAGYSVKTANRTANQLLNHHPKVKALIDAYRAKVANVTDEVIELASRKTLEAMAAVAYFDPRKMVDEWGSAKPLHQLDPMTAQAVAGFKTVARWEGKGKNRRKVVDTEYRLVNRVAALDMAAKVTGEYKVDNEQRRSTRTMTDEDIYARLAELQARALAKARDKAPDGTVPPTQ